MEILVILILLLGHWVSDYIFQQKAIVLNKFKKFNLLLRHTFEYTTMLTIFIVIMLLFKILNQEIWYFIINFWIITFVFHLIVDYITSILSTHSWRAKSRVDFFSVVITDQLIHLFILFLTVSYLFY